MYLLLFALFVHLSTAETIWLNKMDTHSSSWSGSISYNALSMQNRCPGSSISCYHLSEVGYIQHDTPTNNPPRQGIRLSYRLSTFNMAPNGGDSCTILYSVNNGAWNTIISISNDTDPSERADLIGISSTYTFTNPSADNVASLRIRLGHAGNKNHDCYYNWFTLTGNRITDSPTPDPSKSPIKSPSAMPTQQPSSAPTFQPSQSTSNPSVPPTKHPTKSPSNVPTLTPTTATSSPSNVPTDTLQVFESTTLIPTNAPSTTLMPTDTPSTSPTLRPTIHPTMRPTKAPIHPTMSPTKAPIHPTLRPSKAPIHPTVAPPTLFIPPTPKPTTKGEMEVAESSQASQTGEDAGKDDSDESMSKTNGIEIVFIIVIVIIGGVLFIGWAVVQKCFRHAQKASDDQNMIAASGENNESIAIDDGKPAVSGENNDHEAIAIEDEKLEVPGENNEDLVKSWLEATVGLGQYHSTFVENGYVSLDFVSNIFSKEDLSDIGITIKAHQTQLMAHIRTLKDAADEDLFEEQPMTNGKQEGTTTNTGGGLFEERPMANGKQKATTTKGNHYENATKSEETNRETARIGDV